jgi:hypothetical protein
VIPLPSYLFGDAIQSAALKALIEESQEANQDKFEQLQQTHGWEKQEGQWRKEGCLAIIFDNVKIQILKDHHDHLTTSHPGTVSTYFSIRTRYW